MTIKKVGIVELTVRNIILLCLLVEIIEWAVIGFGLCSIKRIQLVWECHCVRSCTNRERNSNISPYSTYTYSIQEKNISVSCFLLKKKKKKCCWLYTVNNLCQFFKLKQEFPEQHNPEPTEWQESMFYIFSHQNVLEKH